MIENIVYIVNPISGKLSKKKKIHVIEKIDPSAKPEIIFSKSAEDAGKKAEEFMLMNYLVVACGGDGFINIIAQKAIEYSCNIAILPFGRGNDFARSLNLDTLEEAIDAIRVRKFKSVKYLNVVFSNNSRISLTNAGVGLLSEASFRASRIPVLKGPLLYASAALISFIKLRSHEYIVTTESQKMVMKTLILAGAASEYTGGGMYIAPDAKKYRDKLNLLFAKKLSRFQAVKLLIKVFSGNHIFHHAVTNTHVRKVKIESLTSDRWSSIVSGDGEYLGKLPVTIYLGKKSLKIAR
ncbi:diacylglycerol kinase family protein [Paracoccaceae bacterium]|nr:diacylglycerol kinase family protein [Paracoccaceae bacterium]